MYGGILEVTKETEDMYAFNLKTNVWQKIDVKAGPTNLNKSKPKISTKNLKEVAKKPSVMEEAIEPAEFVAKGSRTERD